MCLVGLDERSFPRRGLGDGDDLLLQSRNLKPLDRYFPEMREPLLRLLPPRCVVDGEVVADGSERVLMVSVAVGSSVGGGTPTR